MFVGDHGWLSRQSFEILYWKYCIWVIQEFPGWSPLLVATFSGLSMIQILNFVWVVVASAKIVQIFLKLVHYIHGMAKKPPLTSAHGLSKAEQEKAVSKRKQLAGESSQLKSEEGDGQRKATTKRGARNSGPRGWVSVPGGCVGISLGYTLAIAHRCTESYRKIDSSDADAHCRSTSSSETGRVLRRTFTTHRSPHVIVSDNASSFTGKEFSMSCA